ncbi:MAG: prepilin-type N-terminal cleavage/methylation domain-containing protein [candidate division NC10 bacterium]|nr:prepilin-type N-terminal cleavage/methylation domain-containing protein [candidate division NC10 bacterium]
MGGYFRRDQKGFTLIELLIVVAIIALLAGIAIVNLIPADQRARYARAAADTKEIVTQAMVMTSDNNQVASVACGVNPMPACLWDTNAPNSIVYMAAVTDPWAATGVTYPFIQGLAAGGCALGPGCVVYGAYTIGGDANDDSGAWTGLAGTTPLIDDLGNSTVVGCAFGPNITIANPC